MFTLNAYCKHRQNFLLGSVLMKCAITDFLFKKENIHTYM